MSTHSRVDHRERPAWKQMTVARAHLKRSWQGEGIDTRWEVSDQGSQRSGAHRSAEARKGEIGCGRNTLPEDRAEQIEDLVDGDASFCREQA